MMYILLIPTQLQVFALKHKLQVQGEGRRKLNEFRLSQLWRAEDKIANLQQQVSSYCLMVYSLPTYLLISQKVLSLKQKLETQEKEHQSLKEFHELELQCARDTIADLEQVNGRHCL